MYIFTSGLVGNSIVDEYNCFVGLRVIRGRDWAWGDQDYQDGNPGYGTLLLCSTPNNKDWDNKGARVRWDNALVKYLPYRIGYHEKYDLFVANKTGK